MQVHRYIFGFLFIFWIPLTLKGEQITPVIDQINFEIITDRVETTTNEPLTLTLRLSYPKDLDKDLNFPEIGTVLNKTGFRITDSSEIEKKQIDNLWQVKKVYTLAADLEGSYLVPPIKISFQLPGEDKPVTKETSQLFIEVKSFLNTEDAPKDIRDIKPIIEQPFPKKFVILSSIAFLVLIFIIIGLFWYIKKRKAREEELEIIPLYQRAMTMLEDIKSRELSNLEEVREFYFSLTELFKSYLEERFHFGATDLTIEELAKDIRNQRILPEYKEKIWEFLTHTDMVKFAKTQPTRENILSGWGLVHDIFESTSPMEEKEVTEEELLEEEESQDHKED